MERTLQDVANDLNSVVTSLSTAVADLQTVMATVPTPTERTIVSVAVTYSDGVVETFPKV